MRTFLAALLALTVLGGVDGRAAAASAPALENVSPPTVTGTLAYGRTLKATPGRWTARATLSYQWLRDGRPIGGARSASHAIKPQDVGHRLSVRVTATRSGYEPGTATSARTRSVQHMVKHRRTVTYSVRTKGTVRADVEAFARLAQETFDDPRGWRTSGTKFRRVRSGGDFTLWLAQARTLPSFSGECSTTWSCRAGRNVVINLSRWLHASPAWNRGGGSLRDYRHMVVNHETGHWLGHGHARCPGTGLKAPVMMQQSKGLGGCSFNPWPKATERRVPRFS